MRRDLTMRSMILGTTVYREVRNGPIVGKFVFIERRFLKKGRDAWKVDD